MADITGNRGNPARRTARERAGRTQSRRRKPRAARRNSTPGFDQVGVRGMSESGSTRRPFAFSGTTTHFDASRCLKKIPGIGAEPQGLPLAHCGERLIPQEQEKACGWTLCPTGVGGTSYLAAGHRGPKSFRHRRQVSCSLRLLAASGFVIAEDGAMQ